MARAPDGSILLFYDGPVDLEKLKNSLYMRRSIDGGCSWEAKLRSLALKEGAFAPCYGYHQQR